jgi:hypothetical protein
VETTRYANMHIEWTKKLHEITDLVIG